MLAPNRRQFLLQLLGVGLASAAGVESIAKPAAPAQAFRYAFLTDLHLMKDPDLDSGKGIAACLDVVEKLSPRPEFVLVGGDVVHVARELTVAEATARYAAFNKIWRDHTSLPAHWTFGNHDLVGTSNPAVLPTEKGYGKALFQQEFGLTSLFYSFDHGGWHFVVLDDIEPLPNRTYDGRFFDDQLMFLQADLKANSAKPTIITTHMPVFSNLPAAAKLAHQILGPASTPPKNLVCVNGQDLVDRAVKHNVRAVIAGHLHFYERIEQSGISFINSGAVCGGYWKGSMHGCKPGFGVVDLAADGTLAFDYRDYGWV